MCPACLTPAWQSSPFGLCPFSRAETLFIYYTMQVFRVQGTSFVLCYIFYLSQIRCIHETDCLNRFSVRLKQNNFIGSFSQQRSRNIKTSLRAGLPESSDVFTIYKHASFSESGHVKERISRLPGIKCKFVECRHPFFIISCEIHL